MSFQREGDQSCGERAGYHSEEQCPKTPCRDRPIRRDRAVNQLQLRTGAHRLSPGFFGTHREVAVYALCQVEAGLTPTELDLTNVELVQPGQLFSSELSHFYQLAPLLFQ